jgi:hypothetical protein
MADRTNLCADLKKSKSPIKIENVGHLLLPIGRSHIFAAFLYFPHREKTKRCTLERDKIKCRTAAATSSGSELLYILPLASFFFMMSAEREITCTRTIISLSVCYNNRTRYWVFSLCCRI